MKNSSFLIILIALLVWQCDDASDLLKFDVSDQTTLTINTQYPINLPFEVFTPDVTTNSSQKFSNNNTRANLVRDIKLKELKLTITDPTNKNFSFLKAIELYISTNSENEILLASLSEINSSSNTITLIPSKEKMDVYAKSESYKIRSRITTKETVTQDITVKADMTFSVTADPI